MRFTETRLVGVEFKTIIKITFVFFVIIVLISFLLLLAQLSETSKNTDRNVEKGIKRIRQGIFITYVDGVDKGCIFSFKNALSSWNKEEINSKISYLLAVACYYDYLNLKIVAKNNLNRIHGDKIEMKNYLNRVIDFKDDYPEAHYYLGLYYLEDNNYTIAVQEFNKCVNSADIIWVVDQKRKSKWVNASKIAEEETIKLSKEKEIYLNVIPPIIADFCGDLELILDNKGRGSIKNKEGIFIIEDKLCPPLPDELDINTNSLREK